jgi:hypothetical protein
MTMNAFINGKTVETDEGIYQFSSESRAREFLRYVYALGDVAASGKVEPIRKDRKSRASDCHFLQVH